MKRGIIPGEPILVDCSKVSDTPQPYRLGPYGYDRGEAVTLFRKVRGTVQIPYYSGSQKLDRLQFQEKLLHGNRHPPLELTLEGVACLDSDLCFDWPFAGSDGVFCVDDSCTRHSATGYSQRSSLHACRSFPCFADAQDA